MFRTEFKQFLKEQILEQGTASSKTTYDLAIELLQHTPCVVHISDTPSIENGDTVFTVTDIQSEINDIIFEIGNSEMASIVVHDKGVTLHFNHIEVEDDHAVCYLKTHDGLYTLTLSKQDGNSKLSHTSNN